ncbi:hypothetical protein PSPO01_13698 [Paraphaeosphaeria sporulosa]
MGMAAELRNRGEGNDQSSKLSEIDDEQLEELSREVERGGGNDQQSALSANVLNDAFAQFRNDARVDESMRGIDDAELMRRFMATLRRYVNANYNWRSMPAVDDDESSSSSWETDDGGSSASQRSTQRE